MDNTNLGNNQDTCEKETAEIGSSSGKKPTKTGTSVKKIEANRRNARKSTGPKSVESKARSRQNAIKHGIFLSKAAIVTAGDGKEDAGEFEGLHRQLQEYWQPVGIQEELMVEDMAICHVRHRRVLTCETGRSEKADRYPEMGRVVGPGVPVLC